MLPLGGASLRVALEYARVGDAELGGDMHHDEFRHVGGVGQERAEEAHGAQLHREAEPVVLPAANIDQLSVGGVEVEVAVQLSPGGITGVPAVAPLLLGGATELDDHQVLAFLLQLEVKFIAAEQYSWSRVAALAGSASYLHVTPGLEASRFVVAPQSPIGCYAVQSKEVAALADSFLRRPAQELRSQAGRVPAHGKAVNVTCAAVVGTPDLV